MVEGARDVSDRRLAIAAAETVLARSAILRFATDPPPAEGEETAMIEETRFKYIAAGAEIAAFRWESASEIPKGVIQVAHGAGEHSLRYLEPLTPIIEAGYVVYSADHR